MKVRLILAALVLALVLPARALATSSTAAIRKVFKRTPAQARCIARHESGLRAHVRGARNSNGTYDYGLFQINSLWFGRVIRYRGRVKFVQRRWILNPVYNAQVAWIISRGGASWSPWSTYTVHGYCH